MTYESRLSLTVDSRTGERNLRNMRGELDRTEQAGGRTTAAMGKLTAAIGLAAAAAGGFALNSVIRESTDFDTAIRRLSATSRATTEQLAALEQQSRELGATSMFSARQAADAQNFLAMAGFEVNQILGATPGVLRLATAANMDLSQAADIASNVLGGMRLQVSELDRVIDVLAATTSGSNTDISQLGQALSFAAPLAASAGVEIEEAAAAIGVLSDAGLQASRAGTGLVGVIRQLSNITPQANEALAGYGITAAEVDISTRGLSEVLETLQRANISTSDAFKIFGSEAGAAAQILFAGAGRVEEFAVQLNDAEGSAEAMAQTISGGLAGSWAAFSSTLSETILQLGRDEGVAGGFQAITDTATGVLAVYNDMLPQFVEANNLSESQAENLERIAGGMQIFADAAVLAAGIIGTRYIVALAGGTVGLVRKTAANIADAKAEAVSAQQTVRRTAAELQSATVIQARALAEAKATAGTNAHAFAMNNLVAASGRSTAAQAAHASATNVAALAMGRASVAARGYTAALSFLGGPVGVALIAAGSLYYFRDSLFNTNIEASEAEKNIRALTDRMGDLTEAELIHRNTGLVRQMQETASAIAEATAEVERLKRAQSDSAARSGGIVNVGNIGGSGGLNELTEANIRVAHLTGEQEALEEALKQNEQLMKSLGGGTDELAASSQTAAQAIAAMDDAYQSLLRQLDPAQAALTDYFDTVEKIQALDVSASEKDRLRELAYEQHWRKMADIAGEGGEKSGEEAGQNFSRGFESQVDRVADSLQNSITSGDWAGIGATIGASLASGVAQVVGDQVSGSLGAGIASAIGGPIVGAIAGGVVGLAAQKIADFFSDDWDPTEMRQAAQGTGTVLADMNAKSESIRRAVEGSESGIGQLVGINQNMLRALQNLQAGISGASTRIARGAGGQEFAAPGFQSGQDFVSELASLNFAAGPILGEIAKPVFQFFDEAASLFTFGLFDLGGLLGGKSRQVDEGVNILGGQLSDLIDETLVEAYATFRVKKNAFSSTKTKEKSRLLGDEVSNQFSLVFESIFDSVLSGADAIGVNASRALNSLEIETRRISLEGLSSEEQKAEFEAVFSEIFDQAAGAAVPFIDEFQRAGEGLGETLARVANQTLVTEEAVNRLGIQFSDLSGRELVVASERLMEAAGGVEQFISSMEGFIDNFASDAQQFALAQSDITRALSQSNLQLPATRDGYYDLLQAQNGATAAGADNIATLLRLQGVADEYYTFLEDANRSAIESQRDLLSVQQSTYRDALQEAEAMAGAVSRALDGLSLAGQQFDAASRERALASLDRMATTGQIGSQSALDDALASATNINAGEFGTLNDYIRTVARTGATLTNLQQVTDRQVTREQKLLANIERRIEAMTQELSDIGRSSAKSNLKTAKILERIELDGLEVRE